jgi:hypothetical protein
MLHIVLMFSQGLPLGLGRTYKRHFHFTHFCSALVHTFIILKYVTKLLLSGNGTLIY